MAASFLPYVPYIWGNIVLGLMVLRLVSPVTGSVHPLTIENWRPSVPELRNAKFSSQSYRSRRISIWSHQRLGVSKGEQIQAEKRRERRSIPGIDSAGWQHSEFDLFLPLTQARTHATVTPLLFLLPKFSRFLLPLPLIFNHGDCIVFPSRARSLSLSFVPFWYQFLWAFLSSLFPSSPLLHSPLPISKRLCMM